MCFNRCEQNQPDEISSANGEELTIEQAKSFVELQKMSTFSIKSGSIEKHRINIRANWNKAKSSSNQDVSVVETEIEALGSFGFATSESMDAWKATQNDNYLCPMSKLVVIRLKKTHEEYSFIMTIVGDKQYLECKNFKLSENTYLNRQNDFTGYVLYHSLTGEFVNGWLYCDGRITNKITRPENLDLPVDLKSAQVMLAIYYWEYQCTVYFVQDGDYVHYDHQVCQGTLTFPTNYTADGGSPNDTSGSTSAGGISGGYTPPMPCNCTEKCPICGKCSTSTLKSASLPTDGTTPCTYCSGHPTPLVNAILNNSYLDPIQKNSLETALSQFKSEGCMTESVYNYLVNNGIKLDFKTNSSLLAPALYGASSKSISFRSNEDITSYKLKEEIFHALQDAFYPGGTAQYSSTGKVQIEFETKIFKDITIPNCCYVFNETTAPDSIKQEYNDWMLFSVQNNPKNITNDRYQYFLGLFNQYAPKEYKSALSPNLSSPSCLTSIISKCF